MLSIALLSSALLSVLPPCSAQDRPAVQAKKAAASRPAARAGKPSRREAVLRAHFLALDRDGDLKLSKDELIAGYQKIFSRMDADRNGQVTLDEYLDFFCGPVPEGALAEGDAIGPTPRDERDPQCVRAQTEAFRAADTAQDQWLDLKEYVEQGDKDFAALGKKQDEFVSLEELLSRPPSSRIHGVILRFPMPSRRAKQAAAKPSGE